MKKLTSFLLMAVCALMASAQIENLAPGIYTEDGDNFVPLKAEFGTAINKYSVDDDFGDPHGTDLEITYNIFRYKGVAAAVPSTGSFILVCDPDRKAIVQTLKKYQCFTRDMNPDNMLLIPFDIHKKKREYDARRATITRKPLSVEFPHVPFTWEKISDYVYRINVDLPAGEYGFLFRLSEKTSFKFDASYTFYVP